MKQLDCSTTYRKAANFHLLQKPICNYTCYVYGWATLLPFWEKYPSCSEEDSHTSVTEAARLPLPHELCNKSTPVDRWHPQRCWRGSWNGPTNVWPLQRFWHSESQPSSWETQTIRTFWECHQIHPVLSQRKISILWHQWSKIFNQGHRCGGVPGQCGRPPPFYHFL